MDEWNNAIFGRQCLNECCDGPEWWGLFDETPSRHLECPTCGYPCTMEAVPEIAVTPEAICEAVFVTELVGVRPGADK